MTVKPAMHPLRPISPTEISRASAILKDILAKKHGEDFSFRFKNVSIREPPKALLLPYLDAEAKGVPAGERPFVPRCVDVVWTSSNERTLCESTISLDTSTELKRSIATHGQHSSLDR